MGILFAILAVIVVVILFVWAVLVIAPGAFFDDGPGL